jgi:hypothetical protein
MNGNENNTNNGASKMINLYKLYTNLKNTDSTMEQVLATDQHIYSAAPFGHDAYRQVMSKFVGLATAAERKPQFTKKVFLMFLDACNKVPSKGYLHLRKYIDAAYEIKADAVVAGTF